MRLECPECEARIHVPTPKEGARVTCPKCKTRFRPPEDDDDYDDDDYDDRPRRSSRGSRRSRRDDKAGAFPVLPVVLGGVLMVILTGVVVAVLATRSEPDEGDDTAAAAKPPAQPAAVAPATRPQPQRPVTTPASTTTPTPTPPGRTTPRPTPPRPTPTVTPRVPVNVPAVGPYPELFDQAVDSRPPTIRAASLKPASTDLRPEVPTFYSLMMARKTSKNPDAASKPVPKDAKLTLEEVKKACAYIRVEAGDLSATGSGFLVAHTGTSGLVATNYHVIEAAASPGYGSGTAKITTVFNSGQPDERSLKADVIAFDPVADLAVLRVESSAPWPKPINPYNTPLKLVEGTPIQFWGFPLGDILSSGKKNPEITLGTGTVASLRHTTSGKLDRVQISGTMNPGNSGGPLVDQDGRLVGIAVSIINPKIGTGIGFAVPVNDLIALLEGKLLTTVFVPLEIQGGQAHFLVVVPVMDPMDRVETVFVRRWAGGGTPPAAVKDPFTGFKPFAMRKDGRANLPGTEEFKLKKFLTDSDMASALGIAIGEMSVPLHAEKVMLQVASQTFQNPRTGVRYTAASNPVEYSLSVGDQAVGSDARPFSDLTANPDALVGKVVVVRGRVAAPPITRDPVQDLIIVGPDGRRPDRMTFLVDRALAAQFDEVEREHQPRPVRLVCLVGKRGADGVVPVRVARLDFIGRGDRIVKTIPAQSPAKDDLAALNRDPERFAGKTLVMKVSAVPITPRVRESNDFSIIFSNHRAPRNLTFTISGSMKERMIEAFGKDLRMNMIVPVRVTAVVPPRPGPPGTRTKVTVTKIDFLDSDGDVIKSIE